MKLPIIGPLTHYFKVFYKYVGYRLILLILLVIFSGFVASFSLTAIVPLMKYSSGDFQSDDKVSVLFTKLFNLIGVEPSLIAVIVFIIVLFLTKAVVETFQAAIQTHIITQFSRDIRSDLVSHYRDVKYKYFLNTNIGHLVNVVSQESSRFVSALNKYVSFLANAITGIIYSLFSALINIKLSIFIVLLGVVAHAALLGVRRTITKLSGELTQANNQAESLSVQYIYNFKYLKATSQINVLLRKLISVFDDQRKIGFKSGMLTAISKHSVEFLSMCAIAGLFYYLFKVEKQPFGIIIVPLLFAHRIFGLFNTLQTDWQRLLNMSGSIAEVEKTKKVFVREKEEEDGLKINSLKKSINLSDIGFSFHDKPILKDINVEIRKNSCIGIAGGSGSGKTTFLDIVTGVLKPTSGTVYYDDLDYSKINKKELRKQFGYITQEPVIFNDTIANNVTMWQTNGVSEDSGKELERALHIANCDDFINDEDHTLDEIIGDKGVRLSGGQRQRICIARELFRDRDILIFDEATAALDNHSEKYVHESIQSLAGTKTMLIVAHRLSTLRFSDVIYVFDRGQIVEKGSWEELTGDTNSIFYDMINRQSKSDRISE